MRSYISLAFFLLAAALTNVSAAVFMPYQMQSYVRDPSRASVVSRLQLSRSKSRLLATRQRRSSATTAMAIPGYGVAEQVFVGGFLNFLSLYNLIITARILLSWFPQAQGVAALQPLYTITDPYLNLFRGIIPPLFGLDFSPILAFFLLNFLSSATAALGYETSTVVKFPQTHKKPTTRRAFSSQSVRPYPLSFATQSNYVCN